MKRVDNGVKAVDFLLRPLWASTAYELLSTEQEARRALEKTPDDVGRHLEDLRSELIDEVPEFNLSKLRQMSWRELQKVLRGLREVAAASSQRLDEARKAMDRLNAETSKQDALTIEAVLNDLRHNGVMVYEMGPKVQLYAVLGKYSTHFFKAAPLRGLTAIRQAKDGLAEVIAEAEKHDASLTEEQCKVLHRAQVMARNH